MRVGGVEIIVVEHRIRRAEPQRAGVRSVKKGAAHMRAASVRSAGTKHFTITAAGLCLLWMASCVRVGGGCNGSYLMSTQGRGGAKTQQRDVKEFRRVRLE